MKNVDVISKKKVLKAKLFEVEELELSYPNGKTTSHLIAQRSPSVCVFPITKNFDIYLISQYRYLLGKETLEAVAGFIDEDETALKAARRELKEEAGIEASQLEEIARLNLSSSVFIIMSHLFLAKGLEVGRAMPEEEEDIKLIKMSIKEAVKKVMSGEISDASTVSGILLLEVFRRDKKL